MAFDDMTEQLISVVLPRLGLDEREVREALEQGQEVAIDSILMVEALLDLESMFGVQFAPSKDTAKALTSLPALVALTRRLSEERWSERKGA